MSESTSTVFLGFPSASPAARSLRRGRELPDTFPRAWFTFTDPDDPEHIFRIDLTWMESHYSCGYGTGICAGIDSSYPSAGCCVHGAYFCDADDRTKVTAAIARMGKARNTLWEKRPNGVGKWLKKHAGILDAFTSARDRGDATIAQQHMPTTPSEIEPWLEWDEVDDGEGGTEPALKTKIVDGTCIFANSSSFAGGMGCALHHWALKSGEPVTAVKPDVCWELPLRRLEDTDDEGRSVTTITEYVRYGWGQGGEDFDWYCTTAPSCHTSGTPVWLSHDTELKEMMGEAAYEVLAGHCRDRRAAADALIDMGRATQVAAAFSSHPATLAAKRKAPDPPTRPRTK